MGTSNAKPRRSSSHEVGEVDEVQFVIHNGQRYRNVTELEELSGKRFNEWKSLEQTERALQSWHYMHPHQSPWIVTETIVNVHPVLVKRTNNWIHEDLVLSFLQYVIGEED